MLVSVFAIVVALSLGQASAQTHSGVTLRNTATLGCGVGDRLCMCGKSGDLLNGIRDCVNQACASEAAAQVDMAEQYGRDLCAVISSTAGLAATTPAPEPTTAETPAAPATTSSPITAETTAEATPETTPTSAQEPTSPVSADDVQSTTEATATSPTPAVQISATPEPSSSQSPSSTTGPITISDLPASSTSSAAAAGTVAASNEDGNGEDESSSTGLPIAVKAGIGAGAGVAIVMAAIVALCLCLRRRRQKEVARRAANARSLKISEPLPGSGRQYAPGARNTEIGVAKTFTGIPSSIYPTSPKSPLSPSRESYSSQLDINTRRYEDLETHTQPRTMI